MARELDHWLIEDDFQNDFPLPEDDEEGFCNEFNPKEFKPYNDNYCYETLVP